MKKVLIFLVLAILFGLQTNVVLSQEKNSTSSAVDETEIQDFKDKIASKVAELQKKDQKPVAGFVTATNKTQLTIKTDDKQTYQIKIDDILTKIYKISGATKKEVKLADLAKDDYIFVTGPLSDTTITANEIYLDEKYIVKVGRVTEVDKENFSLSIMTTEKEQYTVSVETDTKQLMLNIKTLAVEKSGFSKIKEGDTVHFVVKKTQYDQKDNKFTASKILTIPQEFFIK